jgi:hypothetical protein
MPIMASWISTKKYDLVEIWSLITIDMLSMNNALGHQVFQGGMRSWWMLPASLSVNFCLCSSYSLCCHTALNSAYEGSTTLPQRLQGPCTDWARDSALLSRGEFPKPRAEFNVLQEPPSPHSQPDKDNISVLASLLF